MNLLDMCMTGVWQHSTFGEKRPVDFIIDGDGRALVFYAGWYESDEVVPEDNFGVFGGELIEDAGGWRIDGPDGKKVYFLSPESSAEIAATQNVVDARDFGRAVYLERLADAKADFADDGYDLAPWIELMLARPRRDAVRERIKNATRLRKVSRIVAIDAYDKVIDVLVVDEDGRAAVAAGTPWLETQADAWTQRNDRPSIEEWTEWVAGLQPHAAFYVRGAVLQVEGLIDDLADRFLDRAT